MKIKILLITPEFSKISCGGAGVYAFELANALSKKNIEIHVIAPNTKTFTEKINKHLTIHWQHTIFKPLLRMPSFSRSVKNNYMKIINDEKIDIIHSNGNTGYFAPTNIPLVSTIHHPVSCETQNFRLIQNMLNSIDIYLEKNIIKKSDAIFSVSHLTTKLISNKYPKFKNKVITLGEGINLKIFKKCNSKIKNKYNIQQDEILIFFPGGARAKRKGAEIAFESLKKLKEKNIKFKCIISGESRELGWKKEYNNLIKEYNLSKNIILTGELNYKDLPKYYSASDITIFPSLFEGFGIPILESMACETPIIASKTGEASYIINNRNNGFLINVRDSKDLFNKLKILIENPKLRKLFGMNGKKLIKLKYSWDKISNRYIKLYIQIIKEYNENQKRSRKNDIF